MATNRPATAGARRPLRRLGLLSSILLLTAVAVASLSPLRMHAVQESDPPRPWPRTCPDRNRFGWALVVNWIGDYGDDLALLNAGWYQNFSVLATPPHPHGLGFVQTIRLSNDGPYEEKACGTCPTWALLQWIAQANPGSLWLIGNEMDGRAQDNVYPDRYAQLYHQFYTFLKNVDPTCQVAIGGIIQPTPLRLEYLDLILDSYQARYGRRLPMDVFNTHNYILREEVGGWGCQIPPGLPDTQGMLYELEDHYSMVYWDQQLRRLRTWMRDRGYRNLPLIVSEYGILFYDGLGGCTPEVARDFMLATFDWMLETTDPETGYPADGNRLVQAWNWYSLDHGPQYNQLGDPTWLGLSHLFDSDTLQIADLGLAFAAYSASLGSQPAIDLVVTAIRKTQSEPDPGGYVTVTVTAQISNWGTDTAEQVLVRFTSDSLPAAEDTIDSISSGESRQASVVWAGLEIGQYHTVTATADPEGNIGECYKDNNAWTTTLFTGDQSLHLPLVSSRN